MTNEDIAKITTHCRCCPDVIAAWKNVQERLADQQPAIERLQAKLANDYLAEPRQQRAKIDRLEVALAEAMRVRHFCCMEGDPDSDSDGYNYDAPYNYDKHLQRWAVALGRRVYSDWPKPGVERIITAEFVMKQGQESIEQQAALERLRKVLVLLDTSGGLGVDRHEWIREALAAERQEEEHVRGT